MRRSTLVGLLMVATLFIAPLSSVGQTGDPLSLISSAAVVPFWGGGGAFTVFEIYSLGPNPDLHSFFFNATCQRVFSQPFRMSEHDILVVDTLGTGLNFNGLMALAKSTNNITATAIDSPITVRAHRADLAGDKLWGVDPISAAVAEDQSRTWNTLRSAAQTVTFPDVPAVGQSTSWWFVCPTSHVVTDVGPGIPPFPSGASLIRARVYDDAEHPLLDFQFECKCLTEVKPSQLHPVFNGGTRLVEMVTYVDDKPIANPPSFVGYRVITFTNGAFSEDSFGRMSQMSAATLISGTPFQNAR